MEYITTGQKCTRFITRAGKEKIILMIMPEKLLVSATLKIKKSPLFEGIFTRNFFGSANHSTRRLPHQDFYISQVFFLQ